MSAADPRTRGRVRPSSAMRRPAARTRRGGPGACSTTPGCGWVNPIANHYIGFVKFADPSHFPRVDVYAEKGSGSTRWWGRAAEPPRRPGAEPGNGAVLHPRRRREPGGHHERRGAGVAGHGVLPLQPHRQPRRRPLLAPVQSRCARAAGYAPEAAPLALLGATACGPSSALQIGGLGFRRQLATNLPASPMFAGASCGSKNHLTTSR